MIVIVYSGRTGVFLYMFLVDFLADFWGKAKLRWGFIRLIRFMGYWGGSDAEKNVLSTPGNAPRVCACDTTQQTITEHFCNADGPGYNEGIAFQI